MRYKELIHKMQLNWESPVITEKVFFEQNKDNPKYVAIPWANFIEKLDKSYQYVYGDAKMPENFNGKYFPRCIFQCYKIIKPYIPSSDCFTCCQHIHYRKLIKLFQALRINVVYTCHKKVNENYVTDFDLNEFKEYNFKCVLLKPCPLYAVNIENSERNEMIKKFSNDQLINKDRKLLYSFQGSYNKEFYITDIREKIFKLDHPDDVHIFKIDQWCYYNKSKDTIDRLKKSYNKLLLESKFSLCPSGTGPNSIRFWEALGAGSIPVLLSDALDLPYHELWNESIIRIKEEDISELNMILKGISNEKQKEMRKNCIDIYNHFKDNYRNL